MNILSADMLGLIAPAFAAGIVVSAMHVPLGQEVLRRGIIFIDLAIAQIAALGVVFGKVVFHVETGSAVFALALVFAFASSLLFAWLEKKTPKHQEAFIGCAFVLAASIILMLLASDPHGGEEVEGLLAGQILWAGWNQIGWTAMIYAAALTAWFMWPQKRRLLFYSLFPLVVTLSVQLVGVYLVFASLIMPALGAARGKDHTQLVRGYVIAFLAVGAGLLMSVMVDAPAGPALVCALAVFSAISGYLLKGRSTA
jgi:zinc/manganese transport system permease protein